MSSFVWGVNLIRVHLRQNSNKCISRRLPRTQPGGDAAVAEEEEEELITVANAPICEMDFSYQTLSWHAEAREGGQRLTQGFLLHFSIWCGSNILPQPSAAMLFGDGGKLQKINLLGVFSIFEHPEAVIYTGP